MVSVDLNKKWWGADYDWAEHGDEWSEPWGGAEAQWYGSLYPRIHRFLPAGEIVEIACGFGRWTQFLKNHCSHLTAVDLSQKCIEACRQRFRDDQRIDFRTNDGTTLPTVDDSSVDFVFSFDSLVHVDQATLDGYLNEFRRVLKPEGVAFIHHSNYGSYNRGLRKVPKLPGALRRMHLMDFHHMRDPKVSAESVAEAAKAAGLRCIGQEVIPWITHRTMLDCISLIVPEESPVTRPNRVLRNKQFNREPAYVANVDAVYGRASHGST